MEFPQDRLIGLNQVVAVVGLSRASVYRFIHREGPLRFPAPVRVGARSFWLERDIQEWVARQVAASRAA